MRLFPRPLKEQPVGNGSGGRVFPERGAGGELNIYAEGLAQKIGLENVSSGGLRKQLSEGGDIFPEMWAEDVDERLAQIRAGKSVVYDVWQPNSRFRKTNPGLPFFRLIICGTAPPTRPKLHLYKELYGQEGVPLKYCFVEVTGASTFFSYDTVALPSVV